MSFSIAVAVSLLGCVPAFVSCVPAVAQGTKQWTVSRYDEFQRGTPDGVSLRSDGRIEAGPSMTLLQQASGSYVWSIAEGAGSVTYAGLGGSTGGSASVLKWTDRGLAQTIFMGKELGVQAVRISGDGAVYAATSPDGRVYRLGASPGAEQVFFDPAQTVEKPKYLWDLALGSDGSVYVATGAPAAVYRVSQGAGGKPALLFRTTDQHIRTLLMGRDGMLWAGSDGAGVLYRLDTRTASAKPFAAYAASRREVTSLAMDRAGAIYLAVVGAKGSSSLPPLPVTGSVGVTVTFLQPGSTSAAGANGVVPEGSEIDRIAPDGTPGRLMTLKDDVVYALAMHGGALLAATGNRGRVYSLDPAVPGRMSEIARLGAGQGTALLDSRDGVLAGTSNGGKILRLSDASSHATYASEIFDAGQNARWGRMEVEANEGPAVLSVRSGNVPNALEGWSEWGPVATSGQSAGLPAGRYVQWRASLPEGSSLHGVTMNYLPRNVAPQVDDVVIATGARVSAAANATAGGATVQIVLPSATVAQAINLVQADATSGPLSAQKDRTAITVRWAAHDDNGDDLMFAIWYRGRGETAWRLLKDQISDRFFSFDSSLLPDGRYEVKVMASDAPVHTDADTLTGERESNSFVVDTTPPVPGVLTARLEGGKVHWTLEAKDAISPIAHAEYAIDAGPWMYVEPMGGLSDAQAERYDSAVALPAGPLNGGGTAAARTAQHVLAVRVYDRNENMSSVKAVVQ